MINEKLQSLCDKWEFDMKGDILENLDLVNECFPIWIDEADNDNKEVYIEYQLKFRNVLKEL